MQALFSRLGIVIPTNINTHGVLRTATISSLIFLGFCFALFIGSIQPFSNKFVTNSKVDAFTNSASVTTQSTTKNFTLGVNIADNGLILVSSAKVVSVDNNKINVVIGWGSTNFEWVVQANNLTKFFDKKGRKETISNISVGSIITITGKLIDSGEKKPLIDAEFIRILL